MQINSSRGKTSRILLLIFIPILLIIGLNIYSKTVKNFFYTISCPFQKLLLRSGGNTSDFLGAIVRINNLESDNNKLFEEKQSLLAEIFTLENLKKENEDLRKALELNLQKDFKLVVSHIIEKDTAGSYILIDKGFSDGMEVNMPVIDQNRVLFGRVAEVYDNFSRISLITRADSVFDFKVQDFGTADASIETINQPGIYGVARGNGGSNLLFDLIPREEEIKKGDVLTTSNLQGVFPRDLLVGEIEVVKKEDTKPYQTGEIKPYFDLRSTQNLFVITNFK
ncbi:MAG: rod shape-determining protein MreC [Candidatus Staskawiczbacteria bacterium]|jgi:rod shape-determining protein MreC